MKEFELNIGDIIRINILNQDSVILNELCLIIDKRDTPFIKENNLEGRILNWKVYMFEEKRIRTIYNRLCFKKKINK